MNFPDKFPIVTIKISSHVHMTTYSETIEKFPGPSLVETSLILITNLSGEENGIISGSGHTAHRRRTDLVPTIVMARNDGMSRSGTPSTKHRSPGRAVSMSRIDQLSQPRQPRLAPHASNHPTNISPSKSMSHLAVPANKTARRPFSLLTNSTSQSNLHERRARAKTVGQTSKSKEGKKRRI